MLKGYALAVEELISTAAKENNCYQDQHRQTEPPSNRGKKQHNHHKQITNQKMKKGIPAGNATISKKGYNIMVVTNGT